MIQFFIAITGFIAIYITQHPDKYYHKYACIFGLAGQPFWFYTTYVHEQWGIFILSFAYTYAWFKGFKHYWMRKY